MNNLDPEVAEDPDNLVVYGGTGRAVRSWAAFDAIVRELRRLGDDETLLIQSGKPVGVVRTHPWAPRVLIANSNLVGKWATWEHFRELERGRPDDVRPDDRRLVDLHRDAGHPPGHLRDVRRGRPAAFRRDAARADRADGRSRRDGRRPAARRDDERRGLPGDRGRRGPCPSTPRDRLRRPPHIGAGGGAPLVARGGRPRRGQLDRAGRKRVPRSNRPGRRPANGSTW